MIISASYKTDIPAFYGSWFMNRLCAGYCKITNPYSHQVIRVPMEPSQVDGFVFWTRTLSSLPQLPEIKRMGYPFMVQYGITGYPRVLENSVVMPAEASSTCNASPVSMGRALRCGVMTPS